MDKQLSVNAIYKGMIAVNEDKSDKEIIVGQISNIASSGVGLLVEGLLNLSGKNEATKQIISNFASGYIENRIENSHNEKDNIIIYLFSSLFFIFIYRGFAFGCL